MTQRRYALVTPAKNEDAYIGQTIEAVISQTVPPEKWVIVSDGSDDRTDEIVLSAAGRYEFIELVRVGKPGVKNFGSKAMAFRHGYERLRRANSEYIGNLDADVSFDRDYYERICEVFLANPKLGIAAGAVLELIGGKYVPQRSSLTSAAGSVQLFRRRCYDAFGGYLPLKTGGIDAAAEIMARMHGWQVQTVPNIHVYHNRRMTTGSRTVLNTRFRGGMTNYALGYHPLFQLASCARRTLERPYVLGSLSAMLGYSVAWARQGERAMPSEAIEFLRAEQMTRLVASRRVPQ